MPIKKIVTPVRMNSFNSPNIIGTFQPINPLGFEKPVFLIRITNNSSSDIIISFDGEIDNDIVMKNSVTQLIFSYPSTKFDEGVQVPKNKIIYVRGRPGAGIIYLSAYTYIT